MATKTTKLYLGSVLLVDLTTFALAGDLTTHSGNSTAHVTAAERAAWNAKADAATLTAHTGNAALHVTAAERTAWNAKLDGSALSAYATQAWTTTQLAAYASQAWVDAQIAAKHHIRIVPTDALPLQGVADVIYLVPKGWEHPESADASIREQYVWIEEKWVKVGDTSVSLAGYAQEEWVAAQLAGYYTKAQADAVASTAKAGAVAEAKAYADGKFAQAKSLTQAAYDALAVKDAGTLYAIVE
ncbi:phage upper tail fiber protein [Akkermansia glycaniphila]|uniref:Minor tail protein gp31 C-terminal domain-containing protein n=1 Tax=Akkermansia glycaniphila TaxID=1679444 RepID=A0A1C7PFM8_9BACT|nr:hypothetical protein [Akkermansia glycaniphila]OCA04264.1 hypothetical protein AC781_00835 [Akkermansia glycaniphila]SEH97245.1 Hypothetical protein PYTT_2198 [Akkermansia glycaniphila]